MRAGWFYPKMVAFMHGSDNLNVGSWTHGTFSGSKVAMFHLRGEDREKTKYGITPDVSGIYC